MIPDCRHCPRGPIEVPHFSTAPPPAALFECRPHQCGGTGQPPASQDAKDRVPGPNSSDDQRPDRPGHVSRGPRPLTRANHEGPSPHKETLSPGDGAKVSKNTGIPEKSWKTATPTQSNLSHCIISNCA